MPIAQYNTQYYSSLENAQARLKVTEQIYGNPERRVQDQLLHQRAKDRLKQTLEEVKQGSGTGDTPWSKAAVRKVPDEQKPVTGYDQINATSTVWQRLSANETDRRAVDTFRQVDRTSGNTLQNPISKDISLSANYRQKADIHSSDRVGISLMRSNGQLRPIGEREDAIMRGTLYNRIMQANNNVSDSTDGRFQKSPFYNKSTFSTVTCSPPWKPSGCPIRTSTTTEITGRFESQSTHTMRVSGSVPVQIQRSKTVLTSSATANVEPSTNTAKPSAAKTNYFAQQELWAKSEAEQAIKEKKIFTVMGPYPSLRDSLRKRGWVEKFQSPNKTPIIKNLTSKPLNEFQNANSVSYGPHVYTLMSNVVRNVTPAFVFSVKAVDVGSKVTKNTQVVNHFARANTLTTKTGLCQNLRSLPWFDSIDPQTFYPRCYTFEQPEEKEAFIDDYRLMACMGFIKYYVAKCDQMTTDNEESIAGQKSPRLSARRLSAKSNKPNAMSQGVDSNETTQGDNGDSCHLLMSLSPNTAAVSSTAPPLRKPRMLSVKALQLAMKRCEKLLADSEHEDIDMDDKDVITDTMWDQFITAYHLFVKNELEIDRKGLTLLDTCKDLLQQVEAKWPQFHLDGYRNVWILKPGAKSRGRGIQCANLLSVILSAIANSDCGLVAQKYIERPLLIYNTKFDIRQWFLVTDWNPLTMWFYRDCYLRFCSQEFTLDNFHESIHLSNNSVQKYLVPSKTRSLKLPSDNMWTSDEFIEYLRYNGLESVWGEKIVPGMKQAILCSLLCTQEQVEHRKTAFELFGADFMLTEDLQPWLIEINSSPSMARDTRATAILVDAVLEDTIKVVVDRKENKNCDTGRFELAYKQQHVFNESHLLDDKLNCLTVQGKKLVKSSLKSTPAT